MKIFITSDLHFNESSTKSYMMCSALAEHAIANSCHDDALVLVGDLAGANIQSFLAVLDIFQAFKGCKMVVCGNHDIWVMNGEFTDSFHKYAILKETAEWKGFVFLNETPTIWQSVGFVGSMGWYDYSFQDKIGIPLHNYERKKYNNVSWNKLKR